ncbi:MAG TPA: penicillin acylase family protein [Trueperaceae bacterium]
MVRLFRVLAWLVFFLLLACIALFLYLRASLPQQAGRLALQGISGPVEIVRDANAVPHIYAGSTEDAYFALGFVHAQDRLWQMEWQRHLGAGRIAELVGDRGSAVATDKFLRTLGVYRAAEANFEHLGARAQGVLQAYAAGVNAYLGERRGPLPPEFQLPPIRGHRPEPWRPADSLVWLKMMAWDLGGNWDDELLRARLLSRLTPEQVAQLWPPYPQEAPIALPDFRALYQDLPLDALWAASPRPLPPAAGSNNWVVSGNRSATGAPLLANDPHLDLHAPPLWYFAHLSAPGLNVIGATLPGLPLVVLGRNEHVAWGFTNTGPDTQDLYIEKIDPQNAGRYLTPDGPKAFTIRQETIKVKGGKDIHLLVRETRHGPVISDVVASARAAEGPGRVLAFAWTSLRPDDMTFQAGLDMNKAHNSQEFVAALQNFDSPQQNIVYADTDGHIGLYSAGRVPIRNQGHGLMPVPGWADNYDWSGFIPFQDLPHASDPPDGILATANNKIVPDDYPYFITTDWAEPYRIERILDLLHDVKKHSLQSFARIQADQKSGLATEFLPELLAATPQSEEARHAQAMLLGWDGTMAQDQPEPLLFSAWYREFTRAVYADELGDLFQDAWGFRPIFLRNVLHQHPEWCDNVSTDAVEDCAAQSSRALATALNTLEQAYGSDMTAWRWGQAHPAIFDHPIFGGTPLSPFFDLTISNGGDPFTIDAARYNIARPFTQTTGPGFRALYDLHNLDNSRYIHAGGQSGNPLSRHYRDFLDPWQKVNYLPMTTQRDDILKSALGTLTLVPNRD